MNRIRGYKIATLVISMALTIWAVVSCSSSPAPLLPYEEAASRWDATVDKHIADEQRAARLKQLGRQLDQLQASLSADIDGLSQNALALNANYDATKEDMRQLIAGFEQKRNAALDQYRDIIFAMRREVSAEEWEALTD